MSKLTKAEFAELSPAQMCNWLTAALNGFLSSDGRPFAFSPLEMYFATSESAAEALVRGLRTLDIEVQQRFCVSLEFVAQSLRPSSDAWLFLSELILRLDASFAIAAIERRMNDPFLNALIVDDKDAVDRVLRLLRNVSPAHTSSEKPSARLLTRLARSSHTSDSQARLILTRLCEIDPDDWTRHFANLRDPLHSQFMRILDTKGFPKLTSIQNRLTMDISRIVGFDRLVTGIKDLYLVRGANPRSPSDNWFWRSLFERIPILICSEKGMVAHIDRPSDHRRLDRVSLHSPASQGPGRIASVRIPWRDLLDSDTPEIVIVSESQCDEALGANGFDADPLDDEENEEEGV